MAAGALIAVAGVGPVLGLTPFEFQYTSTVADHYLYLAMLGPAVGVAWGLSCLGLNKEALSGWRGGSSPRPSPGVPGEGGRMSLSWCVLATLAMVTMGVWSHLQLAHWRTDRAAWAHVVEAEPRSLRRVSGATRSIMA